jgi:hypothetical protein
MASTYSTRLRFELPATGEQSGSWGTTMDLFMGTLLEDALAGNLQKAMPDSDYTLTTATGSSDEARNQGISITGVLTAPRALIVPTQQRHFQIHNNTNQVVTVKTAAGAGAAVPSLTVARLYCDGAGVYFAAAPISPVTGNPLTLTIPTATFTTLSVTGVSNFGTTPSGATPVVVLASTNAVGIEVKGRAADNLGILRFMDNAGTTELARIQSGAAVGSLSLRLGSTGAVIALDTDATGNVSLPHALAIGTGLGVAAGGASIFGTSFIIGGFTVATAAALAQGIVYLGNTGTRYIQWDSANYVLGGSGNIWTTGNFNPASYLPLAGGSITGNLYIAGQTEIDGDVYHDSGFTYLRSASGDIYLSFGTTAGFERGKIWASSTDNAMRCRSASSGYWVQESNGNFTASGNLYANSDRRLKRDFAAVSPREADEAVTALAGAVSRFRWIDLESPGPQLGFIAQDVQGHLPEAVSADSDGTLRVTDRPILAMLTASLAAALRRIEALEAHHG